MSKHMPGSLGWRTRLLKEDPSRTRNYLRASFGETDMRTHYTLQGSRERVNSSSIQDAKNYNLPFGNYLKIMPARKLPQDADNTINREIRLPMVDSRTQKW